MILLNTAPAYAEHMIPANVNNMPGAAAQKYNQPFVPDQRPVAFVEQTTSADVTTKGGRIAPNVARSNVGCKTITGQSCSPITTSG